MAETKKNRWFSRIETGDDALVAIKDASNGFFVVAGLSAAVAVLLRQYWNLLDAVLLVTLALFVRRFHSRAAASLLLLIALLEAVVTAANMFGVAHSGGTNLVVAAIVVAAGVRAVQATFKLHKLNAPGAANRLVRS